MQGLDIINAITGAATAIGVAAAVFQIYQSHTQARTSFADSLTSKYQAIIAQLPLPALLEGKLHAQEVEANLRIFYQYFELCNEQAFLAGKGEKGRSRIAKDLWMEWEDGIAQNMNRDAFREAWYLVRERLNDKSEFSTLRTSLGELFPAGRPVPLTSNTVVPEVFQEAFEPTPASEPPPNLPEQP